MENYKYIVEVPEIKFDIKIQIQIYEDCGIIASWAGVPPAKIQGSLFDA
jgi:phenylalanyl-tRNA synthetase beta subunit